MTTLVSIWILILLALFVYAVFVIYSLFYRERYLTKLANKKRALALASLQEQSHGILPSGLESTPLYTSIISATAVQIVEAITVKKIWTAEQVMRVYCHKALQVHNKVNCITECRFQKAIQDAKELDTWFEKVGKPKGCLHGVPLSVKDNVHLKDYDSTVGIFKFCFYPQEENATILENLISAGCIPFCKTNVPQTMLSFECSNPLWGKTSNPKNINLSPGGSSGGESALIGGGGSVLGIGGDIGGSLRIPSHFCGIYTIKPTFGRLSSEGFQKTVRGQESIQSVPGPMGKSVEDLALFLYATVNQYHSLCGNVIPLPFNERDYPLPTSTPRPLSSLVKQKLKVGYCLTDGFLNPTPPLRRAVIETLRSIKKSYPDAEIIPFEFDYFPEAVHSFYKFVTADGNKGLLQLLKGEPVEKILIPFFVSSMVPRALLKCISRILRIALRDDAISRISGEFGTKTIREVWKEHAHRQSYRREFFKAWNDTKHIGELKKPIDFLVYPAFATPATPHQTFHQIHPSACYTFVWNVLDMPVGIIPVTTVQPDDKQFSSGILEEKDKDIIHASQLEREKEALKTNPFLHKKIRTFYEQHLSCGNFEGAPIGIQIVGPRYMEEKLLSYMKVVDSALKKSKD